MKTKQIISLDHHCLHLCNNHDIEETVFSYAIEADVFVTANTDFWKESFKKSQINCQIKKPEAVKSQERIVVDGSSLTQDFEFWEKKWEKNAWVVCIYDIDNINPSLLKNLVQIHEKMILSINKVRMLSDKSLETEMNNLDPEIIESLVKKELKNILVSLLLTKPLCGTDLVKILYQKFKVFISPGQLYPALHELEKVGLLKCEYNLKNKVYSIKEKAQVECLLKNHAKANSLLSEFLVRV